MTIKHFGISQGYDSAPFMCCGMPCIQLGPAVNGHSHAYCGWQLYNGFFTWFLELHFRLFSVQMQTPPRLWHSLFHSESCPITRTVCKLGMNKSECAGESITETDVADVGERVASWTQWLQIVTTCCPSRWVTPLTDLVNPVGTPRGTSFSPSRRCVHLQRGALPPASVLSIRWCSGILFVILCNNNCTIVSIKIFDKSLNVLISTFERKNLILDFLRK